MSTFSRLFICINVTWNQNALKKHDTLSLLHLIHISLKNMYDYIIQQEQTFILYYLGCETGCLFRTTCHESINVWNNGVQRALAISIVKLFGNSRRTEGKGDALIKSLIICLGCRTLFPSTQQEWQCGYVVFIHWTQKQMASTQSTWKQEKNCSLHWRFKYQLRGHNWMLLAHRP